MSDDGAAVMRVQNPYFSVSDICEVTGIHRQRIYQAMYRGELVAISKPGRIRFTVEEVNRWWAAVQQEHAGVSRCVKHMP